MASLPKSVRSDYAQAGFLTETIHKLLTEKECSIFNRGLADYYKRRNVKSLVECLSLILTTAHKRQLLIPIRDAYVKPSDVSKFNQLVQAHGIATSYRKKQKADERSTSSAGGDGLRKIEVRRDTDGEWGFSIHGGSDGLGIFVSWIEPRSNAEKSGLQVGDQILRANDASFDMISHYSAMMVIGSARRLQLHVLAHGQVPGSRMAHKVYQWVDPEGRPCSPPPDPFEIQDKKGAHNKWMIAADERKVTVMIKGKDLGISIRGGIEHGLGIYISAVEEYSVAESYGLKIGDQILEVNGISFLGIVHCDAANVLSAQPCMIVKVKDVGKLPHSLIKTYNQTRHSPGLLTHEGINISSQLPAPPPIFRTGVGSQIMLGQQQDSLLRGHGLLKNVAQSVLSEHEYALFMYHINQYQQHGLPVNKLLPPILNLLDTAEKLQLITELRGLMKPQDIEQFNELTVHKEIMAKKYVKSAPSDNTWPSFEDTGRDTVPQKLSPEQPNKMKHFLDTPPSTSTPVARHLEVPRNMSREYIWNGELDFSELSSGYPNERVNNSLIATQTRSETECHLQNDFERKKKMMVEEHQRLLEEERAQSEKRLYREREEMEKKMKQREDFLKAKIEQSVQLESAREISSQLAEKERSLQEEKERLLQEKEEQFQQRQERLRQELEEQIWKEADERLREEYEQKRQQEREASLQRQAKVSEKAVMWDVEGRIRRNLESRIKKEYEEKLAMELSKLKEEEEKEMIKREQEAQWKREEEVMRLEAEEQSRIELEEKIRRETESKVRAEYEVHLNNETKERVKLTEELKARKSAEERLEKARVELQREGEKQKKRFEKERERERTEKEKEMADLAKEKEELERIIKQQLHSQQREETSDEEEGEEVRTKPNPDQSQEHQMLEQQRRFRLNKDREEEELRQQEIAKIETKKKQEQTNLSKRKELERRREESLQRREEAREQKELERKLKSDKNRQPSPCLRRDPHLVMEKDKKRQEEHMAAVAISSQVKVNFGEEDSSLKAKKIKHKTIEEERLMAEQKLERRLKRSQEKENKNNESKSLEEVPVEMNTTKSFGGFTDLHGNILHINVTKVVKKLGIAIDGGANTKQKAVIIREMSLEGCAVLTGTGMAVNQQMLQVNGKSFFGLKHREVVMEIKRAFEGPMNRVLEFVVLDPTSDTALPSEHDF